MNSQRSQKSPTVLLLDVNNFKKINDTHGHNAGDKVICEVAQRLSDVLYPKDVIARVNGVGFCGLVELSDPKYGATFDITAQRTKNYKFFEQQMSIVAAQQLAQEQNC